MRRIRGKCEDEAGDMGIGTMIIFIAMVLVAAVAASLLISTAGDLNQQAQETGRLAQQEVSSGFLVMEVFGYDNGTDGDIDDLYIKMRLNAGSPAIDMDNVIIEVTGDSFEASLNVTCDQSYFASNGDSTYKVETPDDKTGVIRDPEGHYDSDSDNILESTDQHIVSQGTVLMVHIDIQTIEGTGLDPQDTVHIKIIPKHGAPTYEEINVPECLTGNYIPLS
ncbi:MAG: flagellin [Thermoplasmata archaeon]|nr:flagellin [Thermoplasmata archaeon]